MSHLLDTNVLSESRKPRGNPGVRQFITAIEPDRLFVSVLVIGEIRRGVEHIRRRDPRQAGILERWIESLVESYASRILPVSTEIAEVWGRLDNARPVPIIDGLQAATALVHGLTVVTRNTIDFERTGVPCLNPFLPVLPDN